MNPQDWEDALHKLHTILDRNDSGVHKRMGDAVRTNSGRDTSCNYPRYNVEKPHNSMGASVGWEELSSFNKESGVIIADVEPLEVDEEMDDLEQERKQKPLRELMEQILFKKASIALKTVHPVLSAHEQSAAHNGETLRDRVHSILQQRNYLPPKRTKTSKDDLPFKDHPLKLRVKALMKQRCRGPHVLPANMEVPVVTPPPPSRSVISPAKEDTGTMGFQRFLSLLNKGVDMDVLKRIVNDDREDVALGEDPSNILPPGNKSDPGGSLSPHSGASFLSGRQPSPSGASSLDGGQPSSSVASSLGRSQQLHSGASSLGGRQPSSSGSSSLGGRKPMSSGASSLGRSQQSHSGASFLSGTQPSSSGASSLGGRQPSSSGASSLGGRQPSSSGASSLGGRQPSASEAFFLSGTQPSPTGASSLGGRQPSSSGASSLGRSQQSHSGASSLGGRQQSHSGASFRSGRQPSPSGASFLGERQPSPSGIPFLGEKQLSPSGIPFLGGCQPSLPFLSGDEEEEKKNDCSSRSKSPLAVKKKKKEEETPKVHEQQEQLLNILKTLGLSLEVEEISKLANRTQERLYGKATEGRGGADRKGEQESQKSQESQESEENQKGQRNQRNQRSQRSQRSQESQRSQRSQRSQKNQRSQRSQERGSDRHYRNLSSYSKSSMSSSSYFSRSTSRSLSPSPPHQRPPHTSDSKRRRVSERRGTGDGNRDSEEALKSRDTETHVISTHLNQYSQEQTYCHPHLDAYPEFSDYHLPQYSEYTDEYYSAATNSCSTYAQDAPPPPLDARGYAYPQVKDLYFPGAVKAPSVVYPHCITDDTHLLVNPDLSTSEGQVGSSSNRCLRVISTKQANKRRRSEKRIKQVAGKKGRPCAVRNDLPSFKNGRERDKRPPTEEEIKFNLRIKLEAFNQKTKHQVSHPAPYPSTGTESVDLQDLNAL